MALQAAANPHVIAEVFEFLADAADAASCRAFRSTCRLAAGGFDVAVHTGGVAVAGHRLDAADEDGASFRWAGGWFPVAIPAWPSGEGDGCTRAFVHAKGAPVCVRVEVRMLPEAHFAGLAVNELAWDATSVAFVETRSAAASSSPSDPTRLDATAIRALGSAASGLWFKLQPSTATLGAYLVGFPSVSLPEAWDFSGMGNIERLSDVSVGCLDGVKTLSSAGLAGLTEVAHSFLFKCSALTALDLSACTRLRVIGNGFVNGNPQLADVNLSGLGAVESIGANFLSGNAKLQAAALPPMPLLQRIEDGWMGGTGIRHFDAAGLHRVRGIGPCFFNGCPHLESVDLRGMAALTEIESRAFFGCNSLKGIDMAGLSELRTIGTLFACGCESLTRVSTAGLATLQTVGDFFLAQCPALEHVDLDGLSTARSVGEDFVNMLVRGAGLKHPGCSAIVRKALPPQALMMVDECSSDRGSSSDDE